MLSRCAFLKLRSAIWIKGAFVSAILYIALIVIPFREPRDPYKELPENRRMAVIKEIWSEVDPGQTLFIGPEVNQVLSLHGSALSFAAIQRNPGLLEGLFATGYFTHGIYSLREVRDAEMDQWRIDPDHPLPRPIKGKMITAIEVGPGRRVWLGEFNAESLGIEEGP